MERARAKTVESIFHEALARPPAEREKYLAEACQGDSDLQGEVVSLLEAYDSSGGLLDSDALAFLQPASEFPPAFQEGDRIASYRIVRFIDKGGMSEVYEAYDERLQRRVAVKTLPKSFADDPARVERLKREAQAVSALNHPNILTIYDFGRQANIEFIVSELVEGVSLRELIGKLTRSDSISYARQIGEALKAAHAAGVIHRDIKPENVMVRPDGYVKVLDFGLAKVQTPPPVSSASAHQLSEPGLIVGTPNYMSPEQRRGDKLDQRTDIWSWGAVFYEMLAGRRPFDVALSGDKEIVLTRELVPPCNDRALNKIAAKALSAPLTARYQTMDEALRELSARPSPYPPLAWRTLLVVLLAALVALGLVLYGVWRGWNQPPKITRVVPLTNSGNVRFGAISPDGSYAAFVTEEREGQALKLLQLGIGVESERLPPFPGEFLGLTFSPDGHFIYCVLRQNSLGKLYRVPLLGGEPRLVAEDVDSPISFSPDGSRFVFKRNSMSRRESSLIIRSDSGSETTLFTVKFPNAFYSGPLWSKDGSFVLCGLFEGVGQEPGPNSPHLVSIRIRDHKVRSLELQPWSGIGKPVWVNDGRGIVVAATPLSSNRSQLMWTLLSNGSVRPISASTDDYGDLDASADSSKFVGISAHFESSLWVAPAANPDLARLVANGGHYFVAWTKSGDLISQTDTGGQPDLWRIEVKTGKMHAITQDPYAEQQPVASADEKYVVYSSNRDGGFHLWRSNLDGTNAVPLTSGPSFDYEPTLTPDSKWVIYTSNRKGFWALWKVPIDGGNPASLLAPTQAAKHPSISPDGKWIVCNYWLSSPPGWSTVLLRAGDGQIERSFLGTPGDALVRWSADGKRLLFVMTRNGVPNVWAQPVDGGPPQQLTHFIQETIFEVASSPDGKSLAFLRGRKSSNLVLMDVAK